MSIDPSLVSSKLDKAFESIEEARLMFGAGHYNTVVNRYTMPFFMLLFLAC